MFVLTAFDALRPLGGVADVVGAFPTAELARKRALQPWGLSRPVDHEVCEVHELVDGQRPRFVSEWRSGDWVTPGADQSEDARTA